MPAPSKRRTVAAVAIVLLLAGCANGDFNEVRPSLVRDDVHDWIGLDAIAGKPTYLSFFELTDDERQLRDLAYPLIDPPYNRHQWYQIAGEYGAIGSDHRAGFDRTVYASRLFGDRYRSPSARYSQLIDDIRNDSTRLPQFYETASRVLDIDQKRRKALAYVSNLSQREKTNALRRIRENSLIVGMVNGWLTRRVASYRFALERLVIMTPSSQAVDAERAINQLQAQANHYRRVPVRPYGREQSLAFSNN